ncbi:MAG: TonB-dependent receptor [Balneolaceae bacterium]|nr:TonB-dependent receptor [Balneolaceae bacterium]
MKTQSFLGAVMLYSFSLLSPLWAQTNEVAQTNAAPDSIAPDSSTPDSIALSDTTVTMTDGVTVTASRFPLKLSQTGKVVSVLDRKWVEANKARPLSVLLQQLPGIYSTGGRQSQGSTQEVFLRGADQGDLLIMVDGVPVSDASQIDQRYDLQYIDPQSIDRIEILKGAQSTLWGSQAVAGVIHILTKQNVDAPLEGSLTAGVATHNHQSLGGSFGFRNQTWSVRVSAQVEETEGFNAADVVEVTGDETREGFSSASGRWSITRQLTDKSRLSYRGTIQGYQTDLDAGAGLDDRDYTADQHHQMHALSWRSVTERSTFQITQQVLTTERVFLNDSTHKTGFTDWSKGDYASKEAFTDAYWTAQWTPTLTSVVGAQARWNATRQDFESIGSFGPFESQPLTESKANTTTLAGFGSVLWQPLRRLSIEFGGRVTSHSSFGEHVTYSVNPLWRVTPNMDLFLNVSSGFRAPSLYQLYSEYGTRSLQPETSLNTELGVSIQSQEQSFMARLVAYQRELDDAIVFITDQNFVSSYQNVGSEFNRGIELEVESALGQSFDLAAHLSYQEGHQQQDGEKTNTAIRRPNVMGGMRALWRPSSTWSLSSTVQYIGSRAKGEFDPGPEMMDEAWLLGIQSQWVLFDRIRVSGSVLNALDVDYTEVPGYNTAGRTVHIDVTYNF